MYCKSTIKNKFCGKIVHEENGRIFFKLNGSDALVIVPYDWILWLAPSKVLWDKAVTEKNKSEGTKLDSLISYIEDAHDYARNPERSFFMSDKERSARCMGIEDILSYIENEIRKEN